MKNTLLFALLFVSVGYIHVLLVHASRANPDQEGVMLFGPTGADLLKECSDVGSVKVGDTIPPIQLVEGARNVGLCGGYIAGVNDAAINYGSRMDSNRRLYCVPRNAEMDQLIRVVKKSLEDNPSQLHIPSSVLVVDALRNAFPCK